MAIRRGLSGAGAAPPDINSRTTAVRRGRGKAREGKGMPRAERPLDLDDGPLARFAADLRKLREKAGGPPYRAMAKRAH